MAKTGHSANAGPLPATQANKRTKYGLHSKDAPVTNAVAQKQQTAPVATASNPSCTSKQPTPTAAQTPGRSTPVQCSEAMTFQVFVEALDIITATHTLEEKTKIALSKMKLLAMQGSEQNSTAAGQQEFIASMKALHNFLKADLEHWHNSIKAKLEHIVADQSKILALTENTAKDTETLKAASAEMKTSLGKVNISTAKVVDTAVSYCDALLAKGTSPSPPHATSVDHRVISDMERKAKQVLIIYHNEEVENKSQTDLKDKANEIIASLSSLSPPTGAKIENMMKLCNGGAILQLNNKEAANWICKFKVEAEFTKAFAEASYFKDRQYSILMPRVPLMFDPSNKAHLREIEETNGLSPSSIIKARWIKPEYRRSAGQQLAHALLTITSAEIAKIGRAHV